MTKTKTPTFVETFDALRRTDGEDLGDYSWVAFDGDWERVTEDWCDDEEVSLQHVRMHVEVVEDRTVGSPSCDRWVGTSTSVAWCVVRIPASTDEETWPGIAVDVSRHYETAEEAQAFVAALPESMHLLVHGHLVEIRRDQLVVSEPRGYTQRSDCTTCGRSYWSHKHPEDR